MSISLPLRGTFAVRRSSSTKISVRFGDVDRCVAEIVSAALIRSFTAAQVASDGDVAGVDHQRCVVWINPPEACCTELTRLMASGGKAVLLGRVGPRIAETLGLEFRGAIDLPLDWATCPLDPTSHHDESPAVIRYESGHALAAQSPIGRRPLCRFDFADEWNNLGFGRIALSGDAWSLQSEVSLGDATSLAQVETPAGAEIVYAVLQETSSGAALWFNRPTGPVDSLEWRVVESFLGDYRADDLPCFPYVSEIPAGYSAAVCPRLDCDEAVASARSLVECYHDRGMPISLALLTGQPIDESDRRLLRDVIRAGGSVVSHSVNHEPNWGGNYQRAGHEAIESRAWFRRHLPEALPVCYAVSPFHQNPPYAVSALADNGYRGFVGGSIANDPEYLLGRAGRVPLAQRPIVSFSAQCMLHGDCYRRYGASIDVYRESFDAHRAARSIFGYLDHPFSARYQYGWIDEATRIAAHVSLLEHIQAQPDIWWASLTDLLDFLRWRDTASVEVDSDGRLSIGVQDDQTSQPLAIFWKGREIAA
jgi:hypothetical protein